MKAFTKVLTALLAATMLLSLAACGGAPAETLSPNAEYKVTVLTAQGEPVTSGVIVCYLAGGEQAGMQVVNGQGCASKELPRADYTVELKFTDSKANYFYDDSDLTLSPEKTELTVQLLHSVAGDPVELHAGQGAATAYRVEAASTMVPLKPGSRSYFLFAPAEAGTYEVSVTEPGTTLGCYGTPFFMQEFPMFPVENGSFTMNIRADMVGGADSPNVMVIGIDSETADSCVLSILRTGDPAWDPEDEPWVVYETTAQLAPYTLPEGALVQHFDLTAESYELVFNEADGFFHLNTADGPLVLVYLGVDCKYISCYKTILTKTGVKKFFYDEKGEFVKKELYDTCLREYFQYMDEEAGVYPLTKDLQYIIQNHGGYNGWWDMDANTCILLDDAGNPLPDVNEDLGWLLMCGYIAQ